VRCEAGGNDTRAGKTDAEEGEGSTQRVRARVTAGRGRGAGKNCSPHAVGSKGPGDALNLRKAGRVYAESAVAVDC